MFSFSALRFYILLSFFPLAAVVPKSKKKNADHLNVTQKDSLYILAHKLEHISPSSSILHIVYPHMAMSQQPWFPPIQEADP